MRHIHDDMWSVGLHPAFRAEFKALPVSVHDKLLAYAELIERFGPTLGRPWADSLNGSRHRNMKELRFSAGGGTWRVAFAFDPNRRAILLAVGDKSKNIERIHMQITTLREEIEFLPEDRRKEVEKLADALIAEEMTLRDLRKARNQTQARVAEKLGINQENVSRIEQRSDLLISTLSGYVEAMGGKLNLVAEFPDRPPVTLSGIAALGE